MQDQAKWNDKRFDEVVRQVMLEYINSKSDNDKLIRVGVSNRHVHLSKDAVECLFGKGYKLTVSKDLSQPGQYAANECVTLIGPKGTIEKVRVLGPERNETQVEILMSDTYKLGIKAIVRESGHLDNTPGIHLLGPKGLMSLERGVIIAKRHLHLSQNDAKRMGLENQSMIKVCGGVRKTVYQDVVVRVSTEFVTELHLDMDEANAAGIHQDSIVSIIS